MNQLGLTQVLNKVRHNGRAKGKLILSVAETVPNTRIRREARTSMITDLKKKKKKQGKKKSIWDFRLIQKLRDPDSQIRESYRRRGLAFCAI